jgi:hypothetical protein
MNMLWFLILSEFQLDALTCVSNLFGHSVRYEFDFDRRSFPSNPKKVETLVGQSDVWRPDVGPLRDDKRKRDEP